MQVEFWVGFGGIKETRRAWGREDEFIVHNVAHKASDVERRKEGEKITMRDIIGARGAAWTM